MTNWLHNTSIRTKLSILILSVLIPMCLLQIHELSNNRDMLYQERKAETKQVVEAAFGIMEYWGNKSTRGEISKEEAQNIVIEQLKALRYDGKQYFWINDRRPFMIMHPYKPALDGTDISKNADPTGKRLFVEMVKVVDQSGEGYVDYAWPKPGESKPSDKISFVKLYKPWGWILGTGIYTDEVESIFWGKVRKFIGLLALNLVLIFFLSFQITSVIVNAAKKLRHSFEQIASNKDLTLRTDVTSNDEFGQTGIAVNNMLDSFQNGISTVSGSVNNVTSASTQLKADAQKTHDDVERQHREIEQVASAIEEMSATTRDVSSNIQQTAASTQEASDKSTEGLNIANEARETILVLSQEVERAASAVQDIEEESNNIGAILDVIRGISEQTNLLALNAAIEAARAGEHGRGFAVVADEVRNLSQRTQDSVTDIEEKVRSFQDGSQNAVSAMTTGSAQANQSVEKITKVSGVLSQINDTMQKINATSGQIATAAEQQSAVANEVSQNISKISTLAESTANRSTQSAQASETLVNLSQKLKAVTDEFKYKG
ncbi:MAG: methyl-accepting chemotaxis protein [Agarilytica sp.]